MARRRLTAVIHLGLHKTGSSAIQTFAWLNRGQLLGQGVLYPRTALNDPASGLYDHNILYCDLHSHTAAMRAELEESGAHTLLLSGEDLLYVWKKGRRPPRIRARADAMELRHWLHGLGARAFRLIMYLREPVALMGSFYSQALKNGIAPPHSCPLPRLYHPLLDVRALLQPWLEVFGPEALTVRLYEHGYGHDGGQLLLQDFLQALGLDAAQGWQFPPRVNTGLNLLEMEVLRALNVRRPAVAWLPHTPRGRLYTLIRQHLACPGDPALRYAPSMAAREWVLGRCAGGLQWVRASFFPERPQLFEPYPALQENHTLSQLAPAHAAALASLITAAAAMGCAARPGGGAAAWLQQRCPAAHGALQLLACGQEPDSPPPLTPRLWSELAEVLCAAEDELSAPLLLAAGASG